MSWRGQNRGGVDIAFMNRGGPYIPPTVNRGGAYDSGGITGMWGGGSSAFGGIGGAANGVARWTRSPAGEGARDSRFIADGASWWSDDEEDTRQPQPPPRLSPPGNGGGRMSWDSRSPAPADPPSRAAAPVDRWDAPRGGGGDGAFGGGGTTPAMGRRELWTPPPTVGAPTDASLAPAVGSRSGSWTPPPTNDFRGGGARVDYGGMTDGGGGYMGGVRPGGSGARSGGSGRRRR